MTTAAGWTSLFNFVKSFSYGFLVGLPVYVTFADHGYCVARVDGISMQGKGEALDPHLNPLPRKKDIVLLSRWAAKNFDTVQRGEIVSLISPSDPDTKLIKRVIGLEGDIIKTLGYKAKTVRIPRGHCWIEGDNHAHSLDSNSFGPISLGLINGRASHILWPPSRFQKLKAFIPDDRRQADRLIPPSEGDDVDKASEHMSATSLCYEEESFSSRFVNAL